MKQYVLVLSGMLFFASFTFSQVPDSSLSSDKNLRNKVLSDIQDNLDKKTKSIDQTLSKLDHKVDSLDVEIVDRRPEGRRCQELETTDLLRADGCAIAKVAFWRDHLRHPGDHRQV